VLSEWTADTGGRPAEVNSHQQGHCVPWAGVCDVSWWDEEVWLGTFQAVLGNSAMPAIPRVQHAALHICGSTVLSSD